MTVSGCGVDPSASTSIYRGETVPVKARHFQGPFQTIPRFGAGRFFAAGHAQALWHLLGPEARRCLKSEATGGAWKLGGSGPRTWILWLVTICNHGDRCCPLRIGLI